MRSLDGQVRQVACGLPDRQAACRVGHLRVFRHTAPRRPEDGVVYLPIGFPDRTDFLQPLDRAGRRRRVFALAAPGVVG